MTVEEIKAELDNLGVEYDESAKKADLEALLPVNADENDKKESKKLAIVAKYSMKNAEGEVLRFRYTAEGKLPEVLKELVCEEPEEFEKSEYPVGLNMLVNVSVKAGSYSYSRALAPHRAREIFEDGDVQLFKKLFGV